MPDGRQIEGMVMAPLVVLEDPFRAAAEALRRGVQQLNQTAQRSGLPTAPEPEPPKIIRR